MSKSKIKRALKVSSSNITVSSSKYIEEGFPLFGASGYLGDIESYDKDVPYISIIKDGAGVGRVALCPEKSSVVATLNYLESNEGFNLKFMYYVLSVFDFNLYINGSTIPHIYFKEYSNEYFDFPIFIEQKAIANFLDDKTEKIDQLINLQESSIEKLEEYKQSVITEAVTKGLNSNVEMKNSNISWLGKFPKHWKKSKVGRFTYVSSGGTPSRTNTDFWNNGNIPWMSSGEVNLEYVYDTKEKITLLGLSNSSAKLYPKGTVMVALNGQGATKGKSAVLMIESACNQSLGAFRCNKDMINPYYLNYTFKAMYKYLRGLVGDGLRDGLTVSGLKNTIISFPPINEQLAIVQYLDKKTEEINQLIQLKKDKIELLNEYKKSLIYEAVTGKIEVI